MKQVIVSDFDQTFYLNDEDIEKVKELKEVAQKEYESVSELVKEIIGENNNVKL